MMTVFMGCNKDEYVPQPQGANKFQEYVVGSWEIHSVGYLPTGAMTVINYLNDGTYTVTEDNVITEEGSWTFFAVDFMEAYVALDGKTWSWPAWEFVYQGTSQVIYHNKLPTVMYKIY